MMQKSEGMIAWSDVFEQTERYDLVKKLVGFFRIPSQEYKELFIAGEIVEYVDVRFRMLIYLVAKNLNFFHLAFFPSSKNKQDHELRRTKKSVKSWETQTVLENH